MKNNMIKRSHLSEKKCREIIQLFCDELTATQIADTTGVSRVTINNYLKLIRTQIAGYCEGRNPGGQKNGAHPVLNGLNGHKRTGQNASGATDISRYAYYGFFSGEGCIFADGLADLDKDEIISIQRQAVLGTAPAPPSGLLKYQAIADFETWRLYRIDKTSIVNGKNHSDEITVFWGHTKNRLMKFRGLNKSTLHLHVKESEFRYNYRNNDINAMLLDIMYRQSQHFPEMTALQIT